MADGQATVSRRKTALCTRVDQFTVREGYSRRRESEVISSNASRREIILPSRICTCTYTRTLLHYRSSYPPPRPPSTFRRGELVHALSRRLRARTDEKERTRVGGESVSRSATRRRTAIVSRAGGGKGEGKGGSGQGTVISRASVTGRVARASAGRRRLGRNFIPLFLSTAPLSPGGGLEEPRLIGIYARGGT